MSEGADLPTYISGDMTPASHETNVNTSVPMDDEAQLVELAVETIDTPSTVIYENPSNITQSQLECSPLIVTDCDNMPTTPLSPQPVTSMENEDVHDEALENVIEQTQSPVVAVLDESNIVMVDGETFAMDLGQGVQYYIIAEPAE